MSNGHTLYTGSFFPAPPETPKPYVYPPNGYTGPIRFDRIDDRILWAEAEDSKGEDSHWNQPAWLTPMVQIGRDHEHLPLVPPSPDDSGIRECGTAFCLAGSAAIQAGYRPIHTRNAIDYGTLRGPNGVDRSADVIALEWFGSDPYASMFSPEGVINGKVRALFRGENTIADLKIIRDELAEHVGFPTRWSPPATPNLTRARINAERIREESARLDRYSELGVLSLGDKGPDGVLAALLNIDLEALQKEKEALEAWNAQNG